MAGTSRHETELKNPARSKCQNDNRPQNHREQQRNREGQVPVKEQEVNLHALEVLKDEDQDRDQGHDADDQRRPRSAEAGLALAGERPSGLCVLVGGPFHRVLT